ncbi:hypothetical protein [Saccharothrix sp. Mg75]|uniref:ATP-binding protein n=1 Tax=Saccharothrix sp. Mg75 TaxID=3445357 RepID=UPI003EE9E515
MAFQTRVLELVETVGQCLLVPGRDEDAVALLEIALALSERGATLTSGPGSVISAAYDKAATVRMFGAIGLPFAGTSDDIEGAAKLASRFGWPLIIKPRHGNSSRGVRLARNESGLRACFRPDVDIAQEFLQVGSRDQRSWDGQFPGGQDGEYSLQLLLDRRGQKIGHFCSRNTLAAGVPRLVETVADTQIDVLLQQFHHTLGSLGAWGVWNLQGRCCNDGTIRVFEINARPTGLTGLRARLGFNELDLLYEALILGYSQSVLESPTVGLLINTVSGVVVNADRPGPEVLT